MRHFVWAFALAVLPAMGCGSSQKTSVGASASSVETTAAEVRPPAQCSPVQARGRFDLFVLGSGGPGGGGRAASGFVVILDGQPRMLVDAGAGSFARMRESRLDVSKIDTILLTHLHRDHVDDLDEFLELKASGAPPAMVRVFGPAGGGRHAGTRVFVERVFGREGGPATRVGVAERLRVDATDIDRAEKPTVILREGEVTISAASVEHGGVPTLAYRVQRGPRSIVFSGDVANGEDTLVPLAQSADLLVHEAAILDPPPRGERNLARSPGESRPSRSDDRHASPQSIGRVAARAPVGEVLLTHLPSSVRLRQREVLDSIRGSFGGDVRFAEDCMLVSVGP